MQSATDHFLPAGQALEYLTFKLGREAYGVDIQKVQSLRGYETVSRIANAPEYIKGAADLHGTVVPIVDMRIRFKLGSPRYDRFTAVLILDIASRMKGMVVDSVSDVVALSPEQILPVPEMGAMVDTGYLTGQGALDQRMLILLDIEKLMSSHDLEPAEKLVA